MAIDINKSATELLNTMDDLNKNDQVSILMVTHDPYSASYAQRILFIKDGKIGVKPTPIRTPKIVAKNPTIRVSKKIKVPILPVRAPSIMYIP